MKNHGHPIFPLFETAPCPWHRAEWRTVIAAVLWQKEEEARVARNCAIRDWFLLGVGAVGVGTFFAYFL